MVAHNWNVVHQKKNENIMDWKEQKRRSNGNDRIQKILTQNIQKKRTSIFGHINSADGLKKQILNGEEAEEDNAQNSLKYTQSE